MGKLLAAFLLLVTQSIAVQADTISVSAPECIAEIHGGVLVSAAGCATNPSSGEPALPCRDICLVLPPDALPESVSVRLVGAAFSVLTDPADVAPAPPAVVSGTGICDWGPGKRIANGRNVSVYAKDGYYPARRAQLLEVGNLRSWRLARIRYFPYRYNPVSRRLEVASGGEIEVSFRRARYATAARAEADTTMLDTVRDLVANFDQARDWYPAADSVQTSAISPQATVGYLILTTSSIVNGSSKLQQFVTHKSNLGFTVYTATEAQWGGGTGDTAAGRIRTYLKNNYIIRGIKYVLLIGNPDPSSSAVPMKMLWPRHNSDSYREAPSDYFYADLTGNWDRDGDGYFGEQDNDFGTGGVDRYPEVIVGRIPFYGSFADLDHILQKTMDYGSGSTGGQWVRNVQLSMKPSDANTPGYHLGEAITNALAPSGFGATRVYDSDYGLNPPPESTPCNYDNVVASWQQRAGFHFWWTHGNSTLASDIFTSDRCSLLDDSYPSFVFQCSCLNAQPEVSGNLAYSLLKGGAVATDAATRVSWYYPGQTYFEYSDSNAGLTYRYACRLARDHQPCGDAHFGTMTDVPNGIWMNHCVFNLHGDPSLAYAAGPSISHTPPSDTDNTLLAYQIWASIAASGGFAQGSPSVRWNTNGGSTFQTVSMATIGGVSCRGDIPPQPYGTRVYYYIHAQDSAGRSAVNPTGAPQQLHSFLVRADTTPPAIAHEPLRDTGNCSGPYTVRAVVTDDTGVDGVSLFYSVNGQPEGSAPMYWQSGDDFEGQIPGPALPGQTISYHIVAADSSQSRNVSRSPSPDGEYVFLMTDRACVVVYNSTSSPQYFAGGNSNAYAQVAEILESDPWHRFQTTVATTLGPEIIGDQDCLVLPDNAVADADLESVTAWFVPGRTIVTLDSAASFAAYSGWVWSGIGKTNGYGTYWDSSAGLNDQQVWSTDPITSGLAVGQVIESRSGGAQFYTDKLPADARTLTVRQGNPGRCYAAYRDVPGRGRMVMLGPFVPIAPSQHTIVRESLARQSGRYLRIVRPNGGESFETGDGVSIAYETLGPWTTADRIRLEYSTGPEVGWQPVPGAESLPGGNGQFLWDTSGLMGSFDYRVRATRVGTNTDDESDSFFSIIRNTDIAQAKWLADGSVIRFAAKAVTSRAAGRAYVQEPDGSAGIRIAMTSGQMPTGIVNVTGVITTLDGERAVVAASVSALGASPEVGPRGMNTGALGGGPFGLQSGVIHYGLASQAGQWSRRFVPMTGLNNIGLFVRVCGVVTAVGTDYFYLDDGAQCRDSAGVPGVRVVCGTLAKPASGQVVVVDAISSTYYDTGVLYKALVVPAQECLRTTPR